MDICGNVCYVYSVDLDSIVLSKYTAVVMHAMTDGTKTHEAAIGILESLRLYAGGHIPVDEFESVRKYVLSMLPTSVETVTDLTDWYSRDILRNRSLTTLEQEAAVIQDLTIEDVAQATARLFVDAKLFGAAAGAAAHVWASQVGELHDEADLEMSEAQVKQLMNEKIELAGSNYKKFSQTAGGWWAFYDLLSFAVLMTSIFVTQLPVIGSDTRVSASDFATSHMVWGAAYFVPLVVGGLLTLFDGGKKAILIRRLTVLLRGCAALAMALGVWKYFGDVGADNVPFVEDATSVLHAFFVYVATPIAVAVTTKHIIADLKKKK